MNDDISPKPIYLKDYEAPVFLIDKTELTSIHRSRFKENDIGLSFKNSTQVIIETSTYSKSTAANGTLITLDTSTNISISNIVININAGDTIFNIKSTIGAASTLNIRHTNRFNTNGTFFESAAGSLNEKDPRMKIKSNDYQKDSKIIGSAKCTLSTSSLLLASIGTWVDFFTNSDISAGSNIERFTLENATTGEMKYTGIEDFAGKVHYNMVIDSTNGNSKFEFRFIKNTGGGYNPLADGIESRIDFNSKARMISYLSPITLQTGDLIKPQCRYTSASSDTLFIVDYSIIID